MLTDDTHYPSAQASGIQTTGATKLGHSEPRTLEAVTARVMARLQSETPEQAEARKQAEEVERSKELLQHRRRWLAQFLESVGPRYHHATLANFVAERDDQRKALAALTGYADRANDEIAHGTNIVLFGPPGGGKDHLLVGLARKFMGAYTPEATSDCTVPCPIAWRNGVSLYSAMRDRIAEDRRERDLIEEFARPMVLILSDPVPPGGTLTDYQRATLFEIIDRRYRWLRPTWVSLNVASGEDADERLGAAITDRFRHDAICTWCGWPSYRKPRTFAEAQEGK